MFKVQTSNIFQFITTILVLSVNTPKLYAAGVESAAPSLEYEEALAKSEAAMQESSDSQKEIEQERLNSEPVIANAKMAIDKAVIDEKTALKDKLNAEKVVNSLRQQKSQLLKTQAKKEAAVQSVQKALAKIEKQKNSLETDNMRLNERNTKISEQIKEQTNKAKTLQAEIKTLKAKHEREVRLKKSLRLKLAKAKANVKSLQVSRGKIR